MKSDSGNCSVYQTESGYYLHFLSGNKWWAAPSQSRTSGPPFNSCQHNLIKNEDNNQILFGNQDNCQNQISSISGSQR